MKNKQAYSLFKLLKVKRIGHSMVNKLLKEIPDAVNNLYDIVESDKYEILRGWLKSDQITQLTLSDSILKNQILKLEENEMGFLTVSAHNYPSKLLHSLENNSPPVLTYLGNLDLLQMQSVGFCGSRKASLKGLDVARDCVVQLVEKNIVIISGYASGIDEKAHFTALENGGKTIIVLPEGIMNFNIRKNLKELWDWNRVLVISEFLPNDRWTVSRAMQRNQTIIGLSNAMILIESGKNGGSMSAGMKTLKMRKRLYAPIYEGMPEFAVGNRILLTNGAYPLMKSKSNGGANLSNLLNDIVQTDNKYIKITNNNQLSII